MPVKYVPYKTEYEDLNKLFVRIVETNAANTSVVADELLEDLHELVESMTNIAFGTGLEFLGKILDLEDVT